MTYLLGTHQGKQPIVAFSFFSQFYNDWKLSFHRPIHRCTLLKLLKAPQEGAVQKLNQRSNTMDTATFIYDLLRAREA